MLKTLKNSNNLIAVSFLWSISFFLVFLPGFLDKGELTDVLGATFAVLVFILIPGTLLAISTLKILEPVKALIIGSSIFIAFVIPANALFAKFDSVWILFLLIIILNTFLIIISRKYFFTKIKFEESSVSIKYLIFVIFITISFFLLLRQSLYVPANNLDQFLVWPDTYNALAQAGEITNHGPGIYPFVADAQVPLKYHWGAFSLGSFISVLGNFSIVVSIFKIQFILIGFLFLGTLYFAGKSIGQSWIVGLFSVILCGLTIYPTFPEFNESIGLARPFISSTSMPQFTANLFAGLAIYFIYSFKLNKLSGAVNLLVFFFVSLAATLSKGPIGLLIVILAFTYTLFQLKNNLKKNIFFLLLPTFAGFIIGYLQISSPTLVSGKNGTSLWLNPIDTLKLLTDGYGLDLNSKSTSVFLILFIVSFASIFFSIFVSKKIKIAQEIWPLIITSLAGIVGTLLFEAWGESQLFLLYGAIPFIGVLLAVTAFYKDSVINIDKLFLLSLGFAGQPLIFKLISSFVPLASVLKTFVLWITSVLIIWSIAIAMARINRKPILPYLLLTSIGIGMLSGLTKFEQKAISLPEHPYSITIGTSEIAEYLRKESSPDDLLATNRHCAGLEENQTCTARQFALSALSERRVFLEGWSYTTCPLSEPILNKYWKESSWKLNQDFFTNPDKENWNIFKNSGVDWLVVDTTRPNASSYSDFAELVKTSGKVSLWKVKEPLIGEPVKQVNPCGPESSFISN